MDLDHIFSIKEERRVQGDNTISYKGKLRQILPTETRFGFAKAKVMELFISFTRGKSLQSSLLFL